MTRVRNNELSCGENRSMQTQRQVGASGRLEKKLIEAMGNHTHIRDIDCTTVQEIHRKYKYTDNTVANIHTQTKHRYAVLMFTHRYTHLLDVHTHRSIGRPQTNTHTKILICSTTVQHHPFDQNIHWRSDIVSCTTSETHRQDNDISSLFSSAIIPVCEN